MKKGKPETQVRDTKWHLMKVEELWPNHPVPGEAGIALCFEIGHPLPGLPEPERWA